MSACKTGRLNELMMRSGKRGGGVCQRADVCNKLSPEKHSEFTKTLQADVFNRTRRANFNTVT